MSEAENEALKAAEKLDLGDGRDDEADDAQDESEESADDSSTETEDQPDGIRRLFRTDRALDLDSSTDWWDPRGKGGINRIGAAIKQMGGWQYVMPAVWIFIGFLEVLYLLVKDHGLVPDDDSSDDETPDETDESADDGPLGGEEP